jgi:phosphoribosylglycinamide formyltransferase 1
MKSIVILISGRGSNMEALLDARLPMTVRAVISNRPEAAGLAIARSRGVMTRVIDHKQFADRADFDAELKREIDALQPDFIVLAGFMRVLTDGFVSHYPHRIVNIHPSLLPAFPGLHTHERALAAGVKVHGCTVHFVTAALDHGPIIAQVAVPVLPDDTPATLAARVLAEEHRIYPQALCWLIEDRAEFVSADVIQIRNSPLAAGSLAVPKPQ